MLYISHRYEDRTAAAARVVADAYMKAYPLKGAIISANTADDLVEVGTTVATCSALVWLVGRYTLSLLDEHGQQVLGRVDDYQYTALKAALVEGVPVVIVLIGDHARLTPGDLPPPLRPLVSAPQVRWDSAAQALADLLETIRWAEEKRNVERLRHNAEWEHMPLQHSSKPLKKEARLAMMMVRTSTWARQGALAVAALVAIALLFRGCA
jgi:hypothetical protein